MRQATPLTAAVALALLLSSTLVMAQPGGGPGAERAYDPATETTMSGVVVRVERVPHIAQGQEDGVHLRLKTDSGEEIEVRLGPGRYIDAQPLELAPGDRIEVRGSAIVERDAKVLIAAQVSKGSQTMVLRSAAGVPAWSGQGRRAP